MKAPFCILILCLSFWSCRQNEKHNDVRQHPDQADQNHSPILVPIGDQLSDVHWRLRCLVSFEPVSHIWIDIAKNWGCLLWVCSCLLFLWELILWDGEQRMRERQPKMKGFGSSSSGLLIDVWGSWCHNKVCFHPWFMLRNRREQSQWSGTWLVYRLTQSNES